MLKFTIFVVLCACARAQIRVTTSEGVVVGNQAPDGNYTAFYGIPYAGNVDGSNRFKHAPPPTPYNILETAPNIIGDIICAQPSSRGIIGVENCLRVSIFTTNVTTPKPVVVWLNAEEYTSSISHRVPSFKTFVDQGLVVVSMNFRLSVFGFLCLGVEAAPGNAGIKDIIQGLDWVKRNIAGFGGNPNNVMLMGHGSAAALVDIVTMVPRAQNLVHKAVTLSGSVLAPWAISYTPINGAISLAEAIGFSTHRKTPAEIAQHLMQTPTSLLNGPLSSYKYPNNTLLFAPCIENSRIFPNESVLTEPPFKMLEAGNYTHIPYIAGYVTEEGTIRAEEAVLGSWLQRMNNNFDEFLPVGLDYGNNRTVIGQNIRNTYFSGQIDMGSVQDYLDYIGDTSIVVPVIRGAVARANTSRNAVRLMEFGYKGTFNTDWLYTQIQLDGVKHGGILNFMFNFDLAPNDVRVLNSVVSRFSSFAHTGIPVLTVDNNFYQWSEISGTNLLYMQDAGSAQSLTYQVQQRQDPHSIIMNFWNNLYTRHYLPPNPVSSAGTFAAVFYTVLISFLLTKYVL